MAKSAIPPKQGHTYWVAATNPFRFLTSRANHTSHCDQDRDPPNASAIGGKNRFQRTAVPQRGQQPEEIIFRTDAPGHWTFLNPAWSEITGFP